LFFTDGRTSAPGSFLFSLRNNDNLAPFKAPLKHENDPKAIYRRNSVGPTFGEWVPDFTISNKNSGNSVFRTNFGHNYQPPPDYTDTDVKRKSLLAGSEHFTPSEVEVLC
jgi:hypothetical protein